MAATIVAAAIAAGIGIAKLVKGAKDKKAANALADANKRPKYDIPSYAYDNQKLLENQASQGLSSASKDAANRSYNQGLSTSINGILQGGGNPNDINNSYNVYDSNVGKLAFLDDQRRMQNINNLVAQNNTMADYTDKSYQINQYAPYADTAAKASKLYAQGDESMQSGISEIGNAVSTGVGAYTGMRDLQYEKGNLPQRDARQEVRLNNRNIRANNIRINGGLASGSNSSSSIYSNNPGYNPSYGMPQMQTIINNKPYADSYPIINPSTNGLARNFDWNQIKPQNQQMMYQLMTSHPDWLAMSDNNQQDVA